MNRRSSTAVDAKDMKRMIDDFLSRGGAITQCPPGPSDDAPRPRGGRNRHGLPRRRPKETAPEAPGGAETVPPQG